MASPETSATATRSSDRSASPDTAFSQTRYSRGGAWLLPVAAALLLLATPAYATEPPYTFGSEAGWSVMLGATGGGSFGTGGGGFAGGELSLVRLSHGWWTGVFADAAYDFGPDETLVTAGPELGFTALGIDGGGALRLRDGETELGGQGRLLLSFALFSLYGRYGYFPDSETHLGQVGVLLKLPVWASE